MLLGTNRGDLLKVVNRRESYLTIEESCINIEVLNVQVNNPSW